MRITSDNTSSNLPGRPLVVDLATWQAARDDLLVLALGPRRPELGRDQPADIAVDPSRRDPAETLGRQADPHRRGPSGGRNQINLSNPEEVTYGQDSQPHDDVAGWLHRAIRRPDRRAVRVERSGRRHRANPNENVSFRVDDSSDGFARCDLLERIESSPG
jgi:hypothetical protein